ncbi:helix-turn-helix domain-containing protein [Bathymodiolus japonicus methanotrophic gill symbiont]|nr:helix-turn-helix domain-containing protein [Bathymodiolus japonicus methanotrophic gill symbiont]
MSYTHLCPEERYYIEIELKKGTSQNKIAEASPRVRIVFALFEK